VRQFNLSLSPVIVVFAFLLGGMASIPGMAQRTPPPSITSEPRPAPSVTRPDSIQDSNMYDYWSQMNGQSRAGGALLGKIAVEGEPLPWEPVLITVTCAGNVMYRTQTDAKGNFGIVPESVPHELSQQKDSQRQMETHYEGCLVQGVVPGFRSNTITITQRNLRDEPNLGTLTLYRTAQDAATTVSTTSDHVPPNAMKFFEKARAEMIEHNSADAQRDLEKAVQAYPQFAEAWVQLGKLQLPSDSKEARNSFSKAAAADPKFVLPYEQLAALASQEGNWKEVLENTDHVIQVYPEGTPQTFYLNALANYQLGKVDAAQSSAGKSLAIDPRHTIPNTEQLLAVILAGKGDFAGALDHLRNSLQYVPPGPNADLLKQQIAQLEQRLATK
jgi:Tfp pilus assembly protein PilF